MTLCVMVVIIAMRMMTMVMTMNTIAIIIKNHDKESNTPWTEGQRMYIVFASRCTTCQFECNHVCINIEGWKISVCKKRPLRRSK